MSDERTTTSCDDAGLVPPELPAMRTDTPQRVRPIRRLRLLPTMPMFWFLPTRFGAQLSASGWRAAVVGLLVGLTIGLGSTGWFTTTFHQPQGSMTWTESLRAPIASLVFLAHFESGNMGRASVLHAVPFVVLGISAALLLVAALLMPCAAAGEHLRPLYGRCLRLTLWSTAVMIPLEAGLLLWPALYDAYAPKIFVTYGVDPGEPPLLNERTLRTVLAVLVQGVVVGWWFLVLYRSAQQYAGPPDGPGWERRRPTCLKCGYIISLLPLAGKCPECGHPVRDSLAALTKASQFSHRKAYRAAVRAALASLRRRGE